MDNYSSYRNQLNKHDVVPLYAQLERMLRNDILSGKYTSGNLIPSETVLSRELEITRTTVRKAIDILSKDGLVEQIRGKGTVVCFKPMRHNVWNYSGYTEHLRRQNLEPVSLVFENSIVRIDGAKYMKLVRARGILKSDSTQYLTIDSSYIPLSLFPSIEENDFSTVSLYSTMREKYGIFPFTAAIRISPVIADERAIEIFSIPPKTPLLFVTGSAFSKTGREIEKINSLYSPSMDFNLSVEIGI